MIHVTILSLLCRSVHGGEAVNNIAQYSARLYFVCKTGTKLDGPHLEHIKDSYTAHIRFNTEYVC